MKGLAGMGKSTFIGKLPESGAKDGSIAGRTGAFHRA